MARLIDADRLIESIHSFGIRGAGWSDDDRESDVISIVEDEPTVSTNTVVRGRWEQTGERPGLVFFTCSACRWVHEKSLWNPLEKTRNYCPNCGAKMDLGVGKP